MRLCSSFIAPCNCWSWRADKAFIWVRYSSSDAARPHVKADCISWSSCSSASIVLFSFSIVNVRLCSYIGLSVGCNPLDISVFGLTLTVCSRWNDPGLPPHGRGDLESLYALKRHAKGLADQQRTRSIDGLATLSTRDQIMGNTRIRRKAFL